MIGIYGNKQTMPESQKKELFSAGITYMVSGEYAFAFSCFTQAGKSDLPTLYNKALCCYYLSLYNPAVGSGEAAATVNGTSAGKPAGSRPPLGIRKKPCRLSHAGGCSR